MTAALLLAALRRRGVAIAPSADRQTLLWAPEAAVTALEREQLRVCKDELIAALVAEIAAHPATVQDALDTFPGARIVQGWRMGLVCGRCGTSDWVPSATAKDWFECVQCGGDRPVPVEAAAGASRR